MQNLIFTAACAVVAAVCAFLAIVSSRKSSAALEEARRLCSAISSERSRIVAHDSELDAVSDALRLLRGKFYASRRKTSEQEDDEPQGDAHKQMPLPLSKDDLRRRAGLLPGKPAPHS